MKSNQTKTTKNETAKSRARNTNKPDVCDDHLVVGDYDEHLHRSWPTSKVISKYNHYRMQIISCDQCGQPNTELNEDCSNCGADFFQMHSLKYDYEIKPTSAHKSARYRSTLTSSDRLKNRGLGKARDRYRTVEE